VSGLRHAHDHLQAEWQRLQDQWALALERWRDVVCQRFEREYWQEYERTILPALQQMERLDEVIAQARREVK
jgi:hypothetical protein